MALQSSGCSSAGLSKDYVAALVLSLLCLVGVSGCGNASPLTQPASPTPSNKEKAAEILRQLDDVWTREDWRRAIPMLVEAYNQDPSNTLIADKAYSAYFNLGTQMRAQGDRRNAVMLMESALLYKPGGGEATFALSELKVEAAASPEPAPASDRSGCPIGCISPQPQCAIKGNVEFDGSQKIYYVPGDLFYDAAVIEPRFGERWFCTEQEARDNGWLKSKQ
jgi:hypothetical protein